METVDRSTTPVARSVNISKRQNFHRSKKSDAGSFVRGGDGEVNVAVQLLAASIKTSPLMLQSPLHPPKVEPASAVAVRVTTVPAEKSAEAVVQAESQEIPTGLLVTTPKPAPDLFKVSV